MTIYEIWESNESGYVSLVTTVDNINAAYDRIDRSEKYRPGYHHYMVKNTATDISGYINACNAYIKSGETCQAKKAFDLAWKEYAAGNYTDTDEKHLFILRNNFYPMQQTYTVTEKAAHYEESILARAGL